MPGISPDFDWSSTPLGPIESWPGALVEAVRQQLDSRSGTDRPSSVHARHDALCRAIEQGFCVIQMIVDEQGEPADYRFVEINEAFSRQAGVADIVGRTRRSLGAEPAAIQLETLARVARTGVPEPVDCPLAETRPHLEARAFRIEGPRDDTLGILSRDITHQRRADDELTESAESLRLIVENARNYAIFTTDPRGLVTAWYASAAAIFGYSADEILGRDSQILFTPDDQEAGEPGADLVRAGEEGRALNVRWHLRADGSRVFIEGMVAPLRGAGGELRGFLKIGQDVTERERGQAELRESRRRLSTLMEGIPQLVWRGKDDGEWTWASPQWVDFTGLSVEASRGRGWLEAVHPADRGAAIAAWSVARDQLGFRADYRIREAATGRYRWFKTRATPSMEEDGTTLEWLGTSTDVDDLRRLREHERLLLAELQHRVRNTLSVIRSIARRTAETSESVEDYAMHLDGRIDAFARVQTAVTRDPSIGVSLLNLVAEELVAATAREGENVTIAGPGVRLPAKEAETFGLAVHELTTNAIKFGALSQPQGHIDIRWEVSDLEEADACVLRFIWKESGVDLDPDSPRRRGFGTELLERTLSYQLRARAEQVFEPDGVRCTIIMPLPGAGEING